MVARLSRRYADFDLAEEAVQSAVVEALTTWRRDGPPDNPGAWLQVAAQRNAVDGVRRSTRQRSLAARASPPAPAGSGTDDRLALLFACCHPALAPEARLALTLRAVVGLTTPQIARAFLVNESTLAQRIVRAKRKIVDAGISLAVPPPDRLEERLGDVLAVVYVMFNEGFVSSTGATQDRDLAADAVWLAGVVATAVPHEPEAWGLAALLTIQHARAAARFDEHGGLVLLRHQDRSRWDHAAIADGERLIERAGALRRPGRYQLQAAIAALHATAPSWEETDWLQIVMLYDELARHDPSPVVRLNQAVASAQFGHPAEALTELDGLADALASYHLFHAARAELLTELGRHDDARAANRTALGLTSNDAERRLLTTRLHRHPLGGRVLRVGAAVTPPANWAADPGCRAGSHLGRAVRCP